MMPDEIFMSAAMTLALVAQEAGEVYLPDALAKKYPRAGKTGGWQFVFPSAVRSIGPRSGIERQHHLCEASVQRAVREAARVWSARWIGRAIYTNCK